MKWMFLIRSLGYGGAERQLINLAKGLRERGHEIVVVTFYPGGELKEDLLTAQVTVRDLGKRGRWDLLMPMLRLVGLIRETRPDILHSYLTTANLLTLVPKISCPKMTIAWGVRASSMDWSRYDRFTRMTFHLECLLSRFADHIIVNSQAGWDYHVSCGFPAGKLTLIRNGIDTDYFKPDAEACRRVRSEWGVTDDERLVGLVGRLDPMKDHPTFLKAAAVVAKEHKEVRFACVGDGPSDYRRRLHAMAVELGIGDRVIWGDARRDMPAVYNAFDIAVSSSYGEGCSNMIAEAMACGVPCVVTDVGDSASIVGEGGRVVSPCSPDALATIIGSVLSEGIDKDLIRERILKFFGVAKFVLRTEEVLAQLPL